MDRNRGGDTHANRYYVSLSARRAWIEIQRRRDHHARPIVALRKESVDRNLFGADVAPAKRMVALRKESVDRNYFLQGLVGRG